MSSLRWLAALAVGGFLFASPFLRYSGAGHAGESHMNHEARHGGQLGMIGDHHIEAVLRDRTLEAFVSDAKRVPIEPRSGSIKVDGREQSLRWVGYRLLAHSVVVEGDVEIRVVLDDGTRLATTFDFSDGDT